MYVNYANLYLHLQSGNTGQSFSLISNVQSAIAPRESYGLPSSRGPYINPASVSEELDNSANSISVFAHEDIEKVLSSLEDEHDDLHMRYNALIA